MRNVPMPLASSASAMRSSEISSGNLVDLRSVSRGTDHIYKIIYSRARRPFSNARKPLKILARPAGLEPATPGLEAR